MVARALEQGTTLAEFRRDFDTIVARHGWVHNGTSAWRSQIIYETNLAMAYSAGRYAQATDPDVLAVYPYWQYQHTSSLRPRPQHLAWVGTTLRADDPWWATHYPPNGWRCRCGVRLVSEAGLRRMGKTGPDTAPKVDWTTWRNPRTGERVPIPEGIDPGFGYNPGAAWRGGTPPAGTPPTGTPPTLTPTGPRPRLAPAEAVEAPAAPWQTAAGDPEAFLRALTEIASPVEIGRLSAELQTVLKSETNRVLLSPETMRKQLRNHAELRADEYAQIPLMLAAPAIVGLAGKARHLMLMRWHQRVLAARDQNHR